MYSYEKKSIALKVFHQTNSVSETIQVFLGYPTRRQLYSWINDQNLPSKERKPLPRITNSPEHPRNPPLDVKLDAIKRCFEHGESIKYVSEDIPVVQSQYLSMAEANLLCHKATSILAISKR